MEWLVEIYLFILNIIEITGSNTPRVEASLA